MSIAEQLRTEGRAEGRAELLTKQLAFKFGELRATARATLEAGSEQQLETWAVRVLTASTLEEVLG